MNDFEPLTAELEKMLEGLSPAQVRATARGLARAIRTSQTKRIAGQRNPDGSAYAPRKPRDKRTRSGQIRREARARTMFAKLRRARYLRTEATDSEARVGFANAMVARVARVHQEGLRDRVNRKPGAPEVTYPERVLLGFTPEEEQLVIETVEALVSGQR